MTLKDELDEIMVSLGISSKVIRAASRMSAADAATFDELERRLANGTATEADRLELNRLREAMSTGRAPKARPLGPAGLPADATVSELEERLTGWGVPISYLTEQPRLQDILIGAATMLETPSLEAIRGWSKRNLVLWGERGCGKSFAAAWWLATVRPMVPPPIRTKATGRRFIEMDLMSESRSDWMDLAYASALVIDDAGTERDTWIDAVATLVTRRHRLALQTIITTNLNRRDFETRYGMRVADRLRESGEYKLAGGAGTSLRGRR